MTIDTETPNWSMCREQKTVEWPGIHTLPQTQGYLEKRGWKDCKKWREQMTSENSVFLTQHSRCAPELAVAMTASTTLSKLQPDNILAQTRKDGCVISPLDED